MKKLIAIASIGDLPYAISFVEDNQHNHEINLLFRRDVINPQWLKFVESKSIRSYSLIKLRIEQIHSLAKANDELIIFSNGFDPILGILIYLFQEKSILYSNIYDNLENPEDIFYDLKYIPKRLFKSIYWYFKTGVFFKSYDSQKKMVLHFKTKLEYISIQPKKNFFKLKLPLKSVIIIEDLEFIPDEQIFNFLESQGYNIFIKQDPRISNRGVNTYPKLPDLPIEFLELSDGLCSIGFKSRALGMSNTKQHISLLDTSNDKFQEFHNYLKKINQKIFFDYTSRKPVEKLSNLLAKLDEI